MAQTPPSLPWPEFLSRPPLSCRVLVGFDGFIDSLYRVIKDHRGGLKNPYPDIGGFGREILGRAGKSGGFELARLGVRAGGNAPLMAAGLSALGADTTCIGALGLPQTDPVFQSLAGPACRLLSVAQAATTSALEFDDGKIMLNDARSFDGLDWGAVEAALGPGGAASLAGPCGLIALGGWANMPHATGLWRGLLGALLGAGAPAPKKNIFVDLADISRAQAGPLAELMDLLRAYRSLGAVTLGLNENEAFQLADRLGLGFAGSDPFQGLCESLFQALGLDLLVVHPRQGAWVVDAYGGRWVPGRMVAAPALSTGGGDHFNAGFCFGVLQGLAPLDAAAWAVLVSSLYVERGLSPSFSEVRQLASSSGGKHA